MANYATIIRSMPEIRDFVRNRRWVHRGDVITYGPNIECPSFSTDPLGHRHSIFKGQRFGLVDCLRQRSYGLILGPSNVYGFGLAGNENTMPSLLAERFGFPFANVSLPEGTSRNLHSTLLAVIARAPRPPSAVIHLSGGDFTNFCYTGLADAVYGSPNIKQVAEATKERGSQFRPGVFIKPLLAYSRMWTNAIASMCKARNIPFILGSDTTFFEKESPSEFDKQGQLGVGVSPIQARQFDTHRQFGGDFYAMREALSRATGTVLAGPGPSNNIGFVDEFHYDRPGTRALADAFARGLEPLL